MALIHNRRPRRSRPTGVGTLQNHLTEHRPRVPRSSAGKTLVTILALLAWAAGGAGSAVAHPLGNFTVNHFARVEVGAERVGVRYVVDMAEIPAFQEAQKIDADGDGAVSDAELNLYVGRVAGQYGEGLSVEVDGARVPLRLVAQNVSRPQGAGGVQTLRVECDFAGDVPAAAAGGAPRRLRFANSNHAGRTGWREIVVAAAGGVAVFDSTAYGSAVTDEIKTYPEDKLMAPLDERAAELSWTSGALPSGAVALRTRDGRPAAGRAQTRDRFAELINVPELTPLVALLGLFVAAGFGAIHAFSPGHGKTVVGAYLVGSRGTAKHAAFLGLTVTVTHTAGVFALGLVTLFASQYVVPERLFPVLGFTSGAIVLIIGLTLFAKRLRAALGLSPHTHAHDGGDHHHHDGDDAHTHEHGGSDLVHSHGGREHSHLPPGADGAPVTWRNLLALGVAGGLLPCPSALVVLLAAIAAGRVAYGLALVVAFSVGLAATLTAVGLAFVFAARFVKRPSGESRIFKALPIASALVIAGLGAAICYEAFVESGVELSTLVGNPFAAGGGEADGSLASYGALTLLGLGLVFGLKHATEVDHVVAVSTIVSEHRSVWRAALVGGLWGAGHTISLVAVGVVVLALRVAIPDWVAGSLEFGVALMIIALGVAAVARALRGRADAHVHRHTHGAGPHVHLHFHESETAHAGEAAAHTHAVARVGLKPLLVGAMHGLAGSAALTLLVLTQIESPALGLLYLALFGVGSIVGMLLMSGLVGLPFALASRRITGVSYGLQTLAGGASIAFGLWYAYQTGIASGLLSGITL